MTENQEQILKLLTSEFNKNEEFNYYYERYKSLRYKHHNVICDTIEELFVTSPYLKEEIRVRVL